MIYKLNKQLILESIAQSEPIFPKPVDESIVSKILSKLNNFYKTIGDLLNSIPGNIKKIFEESFVKQAPKIEGEINMIDTCFTTVMKLIGKEKLVKKYDASASIFLEAYLKYDEPLKLNKKNIKKLERGHVVLFWWNNDSRTTSGIKLNNTFSQHGIGYNGRMVESVTHMGIVIDPAKRLILHATYKNFDDNGEVFGLGSKLELVLEKQATFWSQPKGYVLDMKIINKL